MSFFYQKILHIIGTCYPQLEKSGNKLPLSFPLRAQHFSLCMYANFILLSFCRTVFSTFPCDQSKEITITPTPAIATDVHSFLIPVLNTNFSVLIGKVRCLLLVPSTGTRIKGPYVQLLTQGEVWYAKWPSGSLNLSCLFKV